MTVRPKEGGREDWKGLVPFFGANVLFGAGLFAHAFLYNFYLDALGWGEGAMGAAAAFFTAGGVAALAPAGMALDRWGGRRVYLAAAGLAAGGLAAGAWAERPWAVFAAAAVGGAGTAAWRVAMGPLRRAVAAPPVRSRAFSWNVALLLASGAAWTALSGSTSAWAASGGGALAGLRTALAVGAAVTAAAAGAFLMVPLPADAGVEAPPTEARSPDPGLAVPRGVAVLVGGVFVWMLGAALVLPFFNLWFQRVQGMAVADIGLVFAGAQAVAAVAVFGGGEAAQRMGPRRAFVIWASVFPLSLVALAAAPALWLAVPLFVVQGLPSPATNPLLDEIVLETAPARRRGAASTWRNGATEASGLAGAVLGGALLERLGFPPLLLTAAAVAAAGALALAVAFRSPSAGGQSGPGSSPAPRRTRPRRIW
ncbi:MAG: hypothetical protein AMXMBFR53_18070 [Gemmatimonadota bacterium]